MGESGLPSTLTARPSRVRTLMPHPAGHSRQVVRYQVATPGTMSSCGITYGISFSALLLQPPKVAPAPVTPMTFRNSRLFAMHQPHEQHMSHGAHAPDPTSN